MKLRDIAALRLRTQRIAGGKVDSPDRIVAWFGAMQAQEFAYAKWSIGKRMGEAVEAAVDRAYADGAILRTHALRPTWHFLAAADIRWVLYATSPRVHRTNASVYRNHDMDGGLYAGSRRIIEDALAGGRYRTRRELQALLLENGIEVAGQSLAYVVMRAELDGVLCSGVMRGRQHTYALLDERVPPAAAPTAGEALAELTRRYFRSHGPATVRDYAWWSSLTIKEARRGLDMLGADVERIDVEGRTYWLIDSGINGEEPKPTAHLMQGYDEYIVAYTESRDALWADGATAAGPALRPPFTHAVIVDGQLAGHWRRVPDVRKLVVEVQLYRALKAREKRALDAAAERYRAFIQGAPLQVRFV